MNIVVDLDGVVFNSENIVRTEAELVDITKYKTGGMTLKRCFVTYKRYNWTKEQTQMFENSIYPNVEYDCDCLPGAKKVLGLLKDDGHKLIVITLRGFYSQKEIDLTEKKLKEENLHFDEIYYKENQKLETCLKVKADVVIEDNFENIERLNAHGIKCIYLRDISQPEVKNDLCYEAHNWGEVYRIIQKLDSNK